jgi:oxygen-dependent protoporphyrinogen oxidase
VVVVGGGISGLAAASALHEQAPGVKVTVLEGSHAVGGKLSLVQVAGVETDAGAESFLCRRPEALSAIRGAGLEADVVVPAVSGAGVWSRGSLRPLPTGQLMGLPGDLRSLAASGILSLPGLLRVPLDRVLPRTTVGTDISIGAYVSARLGREVVDRLVEPLLGGVYAGHADNLSLDAALPQLSGAVRVERSLLRGVEQVLGRPGASEDRGAVFGSLYGGLGRLPAAMAATCGATVRTGAVVRELRRSPGGWRLLVGSTRDSETIFADAVVLAVPAAPAARLVADLSPGAAAQLAAIEYASVALVTLAFPVAATAGKLSGTGFLVPPVEGRVVKAATYASHKWGWLGAADPELAFVRLSIGRQGETADLQREDAELVTLARADLAAATGVRAEPVDSAVTRWGGALPQYAVGHLERVARIRAAVAEHPGLAVCGAAYDGVGIPACVGSARAAAARVLRTVGERGQWSHERRDQG